MTMMQPLQRELLSKIILWDFTNCSQPYWQTVQHLIATVLWKGKKEKNGKMIGKYKQTRTQSHLQAGRLICWAKKEIE